MHQKRNFCIPLFRSGRGQLGHKFTLREILPKSSKNQTLFKKINASKTELLYPFIFLRSGHGQLAECNQKYTKYDCCKPCNSKRFQNDFNNWTSGNDKIDKFIQDAQLNANNVKQIGKGGFGTIHYAKWIDGFIGEWDIENQQWGRWSNEIEVALKIFDNFVNFNDVLNEMEIHLTTQTQITSIRFYGITLDPETNKYIMVLEYAEDGNLREYLKTNFNNINLKQKLRSLRELSLRLMNIHKLDIVHQDFHPGNILSTNFKSSTFIKISDFGLNVKQIGKGGFGTIHYAKWIDGFIGEWDIENQQWGRWSNEIEVALKIFDNFVNFNDVLNEMEIHLTTQTQITSIRFYGITLDPETNKYIMVLEYAEDGNLREYLKTNFNNINLKQKLRSLRELSLRLMNIHKLDIVHQDFHPGNILSTNFKSSTFIKISDFGLSKIIKENPNNPEKKNIFGVLPYIAPEVLSGEKEYTKATDVYSFGIIAYEIVTGFPPYSDIPHDKDLAMKICNGLRPKIPFHIPKLITRMIMRCWDARVTHRPTFNELYDELRKYNYDFSNQHSEIVIQIKKAEEISANQESINTTTTTPLNYQTHPQAIYTSRLLNYSNLPKPKNEENFERNLKNLCPSNSDLFI
ncbi:hypothetical protein Glove_372g123 [Diversispora epigaea]|uniref:Protein kinase domain-containing protein n=1 Tax=Diversispora epigaea TaxID=1348612 RepID=A0A397HE49_9GLOM|nr:hypothetical protein Glove_372g123 [Diversispora epigaea]